MTDVPGYLPHKMYLCRMRLHYPPSDSNLILCPPAPCLPPSFLSSPSFLPSLLPPCFPPFFSLPSLLCFPFFSPFLLLSSSSRAGGRLSVKSSVFGIHYLSSPGNGLTLKSTDSSSSLFPVNDAFVFGKVRVARHSHQKGLCHNPGPLEHCLWPGNCKQDGVAWTSAFLKVVSTSPYAASN